MNNVNRVKCKSKNIDRNLTVEEDPKIKGIILSEDVMKDLGENERKHGLDS
jgi:hypothetical protein